MQLVNSIFLIIAIILSLVVFTKDRKLISIGAKKTIKSAFSSLPILIITIYIAELVKYLIPQEQLNNWIGNEGGWKGIGIGCIIGMLSTNGPMIVFPIIATMLKADAGIGCLVAVATSWCMCSIRLSLMEMAIISPKFALFRLAACFFVPILTGGIAQLLLSRYWK